MTPHEALRLIRKTHSDHEDACLWCGKPWPCFDYTTATEALASAPAPVETAYCTICHMTEALHHQPNVYTGKRDGRGNPYPQPCDTFTPPPAAPVESAPPCLCVHAGGMPEAVSMVEGPHHDPRCTRHQPGVPHYDSHGRVKHHCTKDHCPDFNENSMQAVESAPGAVSSFPAIAEHVAKAFAPASPPAPEREWRPEYLTETPEEWKKRTASPPAELGTCPECDGGCVIVLGTRYTCDHCGGTGRRDTEGRG